MSIHLRLDQMSAICHVIMTRNKDLCAEDRETLEPEKLDAQN
jgi:hypothetical protein